MDESELKQSATERIRWDDEEAARPDRILGSNLNRRGSVGSFSIRSGRSRREIDPSTALPVQYRTVSIQIEESKGKDAAALQKAKDTAARGL
jgi:sodium/potassium-transporting ATPase subunit alpha